MGDAVSRNMAFLVLGVWLLALCGCSGVVDPGAFWAPAVDGPAWPSPPSAPRVQYLKAFPRTVDSGAEEDTGSRVMRFIVGEKPSEIPLVNPVGVAADSAGRLWVTDPGARIVHFFNFGSGKTEVFGQVGDEFLLAPAGVAFDRTRGRLYLSDAQLQRVFVLEPDGRPIGEIQSPQPFLRPGGLAVDPVGNLYVADVLAGLVKIFSPDGVFIRALGSRQGDSGRFNRPVAVAVSGQGHVAVLDAMNFRVELFGPDWEPLGVVGGLGDVPGSFARPRGVAFDSDQHIYVADAAFDNVQIFDLSGKLLLYFGRPGEAAGEFCLPAGLAVDRDNRLYAVDSCNHRIQVFQYLPAAMN